MIEEPLGRGIAPSTEWIIFRACAGALVKMYNPFGELAKGRFPDPNVGPQSPASYT